MPFRSECENCRQVVLADAGRDFAIMVKIELQGAKWTGIWLLDGAASMLLNEPDRAGERVATYDATAKRWSNFETVKSSRKEYDATVSAGGDCLNVRETSARNAKVITCLPDGSPILVTEYTPASVNEGITWVQVRAKDAEGRKVAGWAAKEFVKPR